MPTRDEAMAAMDEMIAAGPPPAAEGALPPMDGAEVECQVCGTVIDTVTGVPAEGAAAMSPVDEPMGDPMGMPMPPAGGGMPML